ncbi:Crp/Fnr family transcriptional regulator [Sphingomonas sp. ac-8]|uniref:Crp/Fnr family transcriptional regulator n=1 Tax=Sphingomonas sp. ac-8 TaxID=3242977 RepID=UPI003A80634C
MHRFSEFGDLTPFEIEAIKALGDALTSYPRQTIIRPEGVPATCFYLLLEGWAAASITLPRGGRQILKVHLPGDALGTPSMSVTHTVATISTVTAALIVTIPFERFGKLIQHHPRLAAYFLLSVQRERVSLMDQLTSMGRTSAESRLAAFLIDLLERLEPTGHVSDGTFVLPLIQEEIGDALGLTNVHVNRTMRELERCGLIARERQRLTIVDRAALAEVAARPTRLLCRNAAWLPPSH